MKQIKASQLYSYLNDLFPLSSAAPWDKVGLQIPEVYSLPSQDLIRNVVICLDVTEEVVEYAIKKNSNLIISRHPFIFKEIEEEMANQAKKRNYDLLVAHEIQVYSIHTNYDTSVHQSLIRLLETQFNIKSAHHVDDTREIIDVHLLDEIELQKLIEGLKFIFVTNSAKVSRNIKATETVKSFYICPGAGSSFMSEKNLTNTTFVTGEAKWSDYVYAVENAVNLITVGHYMENYFIDDLETKLNKTFGVDLNCYSFDIKNMWIQM